MRKKQGTLSFRIRQLGRSSKLPIWTTKGSTGSRRVVLLRNIHCHEVDITTDLLGFTKDQMFNASQQCSFLWAVVTDRDREIAVFVSPKVHYNFKAARICREVASFTTSQKSQRTREKADAIWGPKS